MRGIGAAFVALFTLLSLSAAAGQVTVESEAGLFRRGFANSREETATALDTALFPDSSFRFTFPLTRQGALVALEYRLGSILESRFSFLLSGKLGPVDLSGGLCAGFLNELPFEPAPGLAAGVGIPVGKSLRVSLYGSSSVRVSSLLSLSADGEGIDQNTLGGALTFGVTGAKLLLSYDSETLKVESGTNPLKKNALAVYMVSIATDTGDFWLDSTTGVGVEIADAEVGASRQRYGAIFAEETLLFRVKKIEILAGLKATILNFTMLDLKGTTPPKTPIIGFTSGVRFTL